MDVRLKWILATYILCFGVATVQPFNQMADQFHNYLFNSIAKNDEKNIHQALKREVAGEQEAFNTMNKELDAAHFKNSVKKRNRNEYYNKEVKRSVVTERDRFAVLRRIESGSDAFQGPNPFSKRPWQLPMPKQETLLNDTYYYGMEAVLKMWFRQRDHLDWVADYRQNITDHFEKVVEIQPFDSYLPKVAEFVNDEVLVIQDILWGERKEVRSPLDKTMIRKLAKELKILQEYLDDKYLPDAIKNTDEWVLSDIATMRNYFKRGLEDSVTYYAKIGQMIDLVESGNFGKVKPLKWNQMT